MIVQMGFAQAKQTLNDCVMRYVPNIESRDLVVDIHRYLLSGIQSLKILSSVSCIDARSLKCIAMQVQLAFIYDSDTVVTK